MSIAAKIARARQQVAAKQLGAAPSTVGTRPKLPDRLASCVHRGDRLAGQPCGSPLFHCNLFGDTAVQFKECTGANRTCASCPKYEKKESSSAVLNRQMAALADGFCQSLPPYPHGHYANRGIVVVGGGKYWASAYVTCRMIRHVGCTLPVQVWYLGERERDDRYAELLKPFEVEAVDTLAHPAASETRGLTGFNGQAPFEAKSFAVLHSPFEEVLLLDSDNYPCSDPTILFDEPRYVKAGGTFWPDGAQTNAMTRWHQWGVQKFAPECGWETGQIVIHKRKAWRQLNMARWYDDHGDWCYGGGAHHDHGDKGPWRVSWARFQTSPAFYSTKCVWKDVAFLQPGPDGKTTLFVHRCRGKLVLAQTHFQSTPQNSTNRKYGLPGEEDAFKFLDELRATLT